MDTDLSPTTPHSLLLHCKIQQTMNKKLLILGASALIAGFFALTAFDGKTLAQQKAEIAQTVTMQLEELRAQKAQECTDKVNTEAQRRFDEIVAARAAEEANKKPGKPSKPGKKPGGNKGPSVDPLPQPAPAPSGDPIKDKMQGNDPIKDKMQKKDADPIKDKLKKAGGGGK